MKKFSSTGLNWMHVTGTQHESRAQVSIEIKVITKATAKMKLARNNIL